MSNASFCLQQFNVLTSRIVLTVENTYAAVEELELNRLFDCFYRADKARKFTGGYARWTFNGKGDRRKTQG